MGDGAQGQKGKRKIGQREKGKGEKVDRMGGGGRELRERFQNCGHRQSWK